MPNQFMGIKAKIMSFDENIPYLTFNQIYRKLKKKVESRQLKKRMVIDNWTQSKVLDLNFMTMYNELKEITFKAHLMGFPEQLMKKTLMKIHYFIMSMESHHLTKRMGAQGDGWKKSGSITSSSFGNKRTGYYG